MAPGIAAYAPTTQKNVPKYLTPIGAFDMLIEKPIRHIMSPDRMKGDRILSLSEKWEKAYSVTARFSNQTPKICRGEEQRTSTNVRRDTEELTDRSGETEPRRKCRLV